MNFHLKRILLLVSVMIVLSIRAETAEPHDQDQTLGIWHNPHSGITGQVFKLAVVVQPPPPGSPGSGGPPSIELLPYQATLLIRSDEGRFVTSIETAQNGTFQAFLKPGRYVIVPYVSPQEAPSLSAAPVAVTVEKKEFTPTTVVYVDAT
jgi:hypothetical protein